MLIAPAAGFLGILPFVLQLNISFMQFLLIIVAAIVVSYIGGLLFGAPGYLTLKYLGYSQTKYLVAYAVLLVIGTSILFGDPYVIVSLGPPTLLVAGAFCFIRGPAINVSQAVNHNA
jgi:hypothetical protein